MKLTINVRLARTRKNKNLAKVFLIFYKLKRNKEFQTDKLIMNVMILDIKKSFSLVLKSINMLVDIN